jgi:hypothetical protein
MLAGKLIVSVNLFIDPVQLYFYIGYTNIDYKTRGVRGVRSTIVKPRATLFYFYYGGTLITVHYTTRLWVSFVGYVASLLLIR